MFEVFCLVFLKKKKLIKYENKINGIVYKNFRLTKIVLHWAMANPTKVTET